MCTFLESGHLSSLVSLEIQTRRVSTLYCCTYCIVLDFSVSIIIIALSPLSELEYRAAVASVVHVNSDNRSVSNILGSVETKVVKVVKQGLLFQKMANNCWHSIVCSTASVIIYQSRVLLLLLGEVSPHVTVCYLLGESCESVPLHLVKPFTIIGASSSHFAIPVQYDSSFCKCFNSTEVCVKMLS